MGNGSLAGRSASTTVTSTPGVVGFSGPKYETYGSNQPVPRSHKAISQSQNQSSVSPPVVGDLPQGVNYNSATGLYESHIRATNGRFIDLGAFSTAAEAHQKYLEAIPIHHPGKAAFPGANPSSQAGDAQQNAGQDGGCDSLNVERPDSFTVLVDFEGTGGWRPLGIRLTGLVDNSALVVVEVMKGPIMEWNIQNPKLAVKPRDRIMEVNGVSGESNALVQALKNKERLSIHVRKPKEFTVHLAKYGETKVGLEVDRSDGKTLQIRAIKPGGLVEKWNQANPSEVITVYNAIIEVNGVRGDTETMLHAIFFEDEVDMLLQ
mmetsp:Transcript_6251/g.13750  ORF Transcript_6251/g.13750 Transcript_6251/m.13750 type:complete len:320 (+) Transcript_6251:104-1063(+)